MSKTTISKSKNVVLRKKASKNGFSLYLDYHINGKRKYEFLGLNISNNVRLTDEDKRTLQLAERVKSTRIIEINAKRFDAEDLIKKPEDFISYMKEYPESKHLKKNSTKKYISTINYLNQCFNKPIQFSDLTSSNIDKFKYFLLNQVSSSTADIYLTALKTVVKKAIEDGFVTNDPFRNIDTIKKKKALPKFLTLDELKILLDDVETWKESDSKKAFLFACFSGLRISDLRRLKRKHIIVQNNQYKIRWEQTKTKSEEYNPMNEIITKFVNLKCDANSLLFPNISSGDNPNANIKRWMKRLNIDKPVTFHSSRHTYATMLISSGVDLYTVSKLLGHSDIKVTQVYAKVVDQKKIEAVNSIPKFEI